MTLLLPRQSVGTSLSRMCLHSEAMPCAQLSSTLMRWRQRSFGTAAADASHGMPAQLSPPSQEAASAFGGVGFIGLGAMGHHMAFNLVNAGFSLQVFDKSSAAVKLLEGRLAGAAAKGRLTVAGSPKGMAENPSLRAVITMLPATEHVKSVYEGADGILSAHGGVWPRLLIDCSTISPTYTEGLGKLLGSQQAAKQPSQPDGASGGLVFIDAPVSGGVPGAQAATLTFMCGGEEEAVQQAMPLLSAMGRRVVHMGLRHGSGQVAKLCNNLACGIEMAAVSEALALGAAAGLDPRLLSQVLNTSSGRCWSSDTYNPCPGVMPGVPSSSGYKGGFSSALMLKDVRLALELAGRCSQPTPMGQAAAEIYGQVVKQCEAQGTMLDFSAIYQLVYGGKAAK